MSSEGEIQLPVQGAQEPAPDVIAVTDVCKQYTLYKSPSQRLIHTFAPLIR